MRHLNTFKECEAKILEAALKAIEGTTGLRGTVNEGVLRNPDAIVTFGAGKHEYRYAAEIKTVDRFAVLGTIKNKFEAGTLPGLLVAPYITAEVAERCRAMGIQFIDVAGNAYLQGDGLRVFVTGRKRNPLTIPKTKDRATTPTGMKVVFALLCKPQLIDAPYRTIAQEAGVALGTIGWVLRALRNRGHLLKRGHHFVDAKRLVEEWVINYPLQLRPAVLKQKFTAPIINWWGNAHLEKYNAMWGGEIAGEILADYRKPGTATIYMHDDPIKIIVDHHLRADPKGNIEILEKFWHFEVATDKQFIVPPLLVYADLMATQDPRNHEVAKIIYQRYIANAYD